MNLIAPSLLSADFLNLEADIEMVNRSEADWFHCDVIRQGGCRHHHLPL